MDNKVNYTLVGAFVFIMMISLVLFMLWMSKIGLDEEPFSQYTIIVKDSVSGLNIESPVKLRGVEVGNVVNIEIDSDNSEIINVLIDVKPGVPIKKDTMAYLTAQGITGLSYIELKGGSKNSDLLKSGSSIPSGQSLFDKLETSASTLSQQVSQTLQRVDNLLSDNNLNSMSSVLANFNKTSQQLELLVSDVIPQFVNQKNAKSFESTLLNSEQLTKTLSQQSQKVPQLLDKTIMLESSVEKTLSDYKQLALNFMTLSDSIQKRVDRGEFDIKQMTEHHLDALSVLLTDLQMLTSQANEVLEQLKNSPSDIFFKQENIKLGPGEED